MTEMKVTLVYDEQELPNEMADFLEKHWKQKMLSIDLNLKAFLKSARLYTPEQIAKDLKYLDLTMEDLSKMYLKIENIRKIFQEYTDFKNSEVLEENKKEQDKSNAAKQDNKLTFSDA